MCEIKEVSGATKGEIKTMDINNIPDGWSIKEGIKSRTTGKKRIFILDSNNNPVGASCGKCGAVLGVEGFSKNKNGKYGINNICKSCDKGKSRDYYIKNKEEILTS